MTFSTLETSRKDGAPIILLKLTWGNATPIVFTDALETVSFDDGGGSEDYLPIAMKFPDVQVDGTLDRSELKVEISDNADISTKFLLYPPAEEMVATIRYGHDGDSEFPLGFSGVVQSVERDDGGKSIISVEPIASAFRRPVLRRRYQFTCPYRLYTSPCTASKAAATSTIAAVTVNSTSIAVASGWEGANELADYFGGTVEWTDGDGNTETHSIINAQTELITVGGIITTLVATDNFSVILGCNRQRTHCDNLHGVVEDFGGFEFIPTDNPFSGVNLFY